MVVTHLPFDLRFRGECGDRIDHDHIDGCRSHQHVGDLKRLFAGVGLGHQQILDVDAQPLSIGRVKRVLRIDKCAGATGFLCLSNHR